MINFRHILTLGLLVIFSGVISMTAKAGTGNPWADGTFFIVGLPSVPLFATSVLSAAAVSKKKMAVVDAEQDALNVLQNIPPTDRFLEAQAIVEEYRQTQFQNSEEAALAILNEIQILTLEQNSTP